MPPAKLPGTISILTESLRISKERWQVLGGIFLPYLLIVIGLGIVTKYIPENVPPNPAVFLLIAFIGVLIFMVLALWVMGAGTVAVLATEHVSTQEAFREAGRKLPSYIWTNFLIGCGITLGFILLIIPGIILLTKWYFGPIFVFTENRGGPEALKRSSEVTKGYRLAILGRTILICLILYVPLFIFLGILTAALGEGIVQSVLYNILSTVTTVISTVMWVVLYRAAMERAANKTIA